MGQNEDLIGYMKSNNFLKSKALKKALRSVIRENFVPENLKEYAYKDIPLHIGRGQTISQPSTVVIMTEALDVKPKQKILEVGTGSGWQAALLSRLVESGKVYTIEIIHELFLFAKRNIEKMKIKNVELFEGDGSLGLEKFSPYDRIIVTAGCPGIPQPLLNQLKINGKIVIPIGQIYQQMYVITKKKDGIQKENIGFFAFVPLRGKYGFK